MDRGEYAASLVPHALALVGVVRDEGPGAVRHLIDGIRRAPRPPGVDPVEALAVVLAGLVPDDQTAAELLAWTAPINPQPAAARTQRHLRGVA